MQDYSDLIRRHREMDADITLCSCSVPRDQGSKRGLVRVDPGTGRHAERLWALMAACS